jgi:hypothetical protein
LNEAELYIFSLVTSPTFKRKFASGCKCVLVVLAGDTQRSPSLSRAKIFASGGLVVPDEESH